ncbi:MAG: hypothetical protein Kow0069_00850 [Promethearchaeota archaeon]
MDPKCTKCGSTQLNHVGDNIYECLACKKIIMIKTEKEEGAAEVEEGEFEDGAVFHSKASLSKKYEICEKGITVLKEPTRWIAVLVCHPPDEPKSRYVRLSWWRKSFYEHAGMFKIWEPSVLKNTIAALEKIDANFDQNFAFTGDFSDDGSDDGVATSFDGTCPNCKKKLRKNRSGRYYECVCGEIVIIEDGMPIFNIPPEQLPLSFSANFPINYYVPDAGITVKWLMGEWKAVVVIHDPDNPEKRFLRFYWWTRDLSEYMMGGGIPGSSSSLGWSAKRGAMSANVYRRELVPKIVDALKKVKEELD